MDLQVRIKEKAGTTSDKFSKCCKELMSDLKINEIRMYDICAFAFETNIKLPKDV